VFKFKTFYLVVFSLPSVVLDLDSKGLSKRMRLVTDIDMENGMAEPNGNLFFKDHNTDT
jgi:hypothetical protein